MSWCDNVLSTIVVVASELSWYNNEISTIWSSSFSVELDGYQRRNVLKRRTTLKILLSSVPGSAAIMMGTLGWSEKANAMELSDNRGRAIASYNAMQQYFYKQDGSHLYLEQYQIGRASCRERV